MLSLLMQLLTLCRIVFTQKKIRNFGILLCQEKIPVYGTRQTMFWRIIQMDGSLIYAVLMQRHIGTWFRQADNIEFVII